MASLHYQHIKDNRIENVTADEYLALLTDHQWEERLNNKIERLIRQAGFREQASVADVEYNQQRNLEKICLPAWPLWTLLNEKKTS